MSLRERLEALKVINVMERVIVEKLNTDIDALNMNCTCNRCLADVLAISLNQLPPKYIVNNAFEPVIRASQEADHQEATRILAVMSYAAKVVSDAPRCHVKNEEKSDG